MPAPTRGLALLLLAAALLLLAAAPRAVDAADSASLKLPSFCDPAPYPDALTATNMSRGSPSFKIYHNLWYHNAKWYALVDGSVDATTIEDGLSVNVGVTKLPVADIKSFTANFKTCYVPGNTLMVDFPFPAFPDNLGHLAEVRAAQRVRRGGSTPCRAAGRARRRGCGSAARRSRCRAAPPLPPPAARVARLPAEPCSSSPRPARLISPPAFPPPAPCRRS
jgi:hypothetical protein